MVKVDPLNVVSHNIEAYKNLCTSLKNFIFSSISWIGICILYSWLSFVRNVSWWGFPGKKTFKILKNKLLGI
jgi:hypothetical protein